jgi:O-methyltransferase
MLSDDQLIFLAGLTRDIIKVGVPGDLVECGVWRGGASFLMARVLKSSGTLDRKVWLFDSFEGLPPPESIDGGKALSWAADTGSRFYYDNCRATIDEVQQTANQLGLAPYTKLVKGWFDETLPANRDLVGPVAILLIDSDWHTSVKCCLDNLYDYVVPGGYVVVDDYYTWSGCAIAVHEFLGERRLAHGLRSADGFAYFRKE